MKKMRKVFMIAAALSLVLAFSVAASATQSYGETINGNRYSCSLVRNQTSATANTSCTASGSACGVALTLWYYYQEDGILKYGSGNSTGTGIQTASAFVNGKGTQVATYYASSTHTVYYGSITWQHTLYE